MAVLVPTLAMRTPSVHFWLAAWPSLDAPSALQGSAVHLKASSKLPVVRAKLATSAVDPASQLAVHVPTLTMLTPAVHFWLAAWPSLDAPSSLHDPACK